jgi:hypothetical protein
MSSPPGRSTLAAPRRRRSLEAEAALALAAWPRSADPATLGAIEELEHADDWKVRREAESLRTSPSARPSAGGDARRANLIRLLEESDGAEAGGRRTRGSARRRRAGSARSAAMHGLPSPSSPALRAVLVVKAEALVGIGSRG